MSEVFAPLQLSLMQVLWAIRRTSPIDTNVERCNFGNAVFLHALLGEKVLAHGAKLATFHASLPINLSVVCVDVRNQDTESLRGKHFQITEEAVVN